MREFEYTCNRCNSVWYAAKKDIREYKRNKSALRVAKTKRTADRLNVFNGAKYYVRDSAEIAQMQFANNDPERCPSCGSRDVSKRIVGAQYVEETPVYQQEVFHNEYTSGNESYKNVYRGPNRFLLTIITILMPYVGIYLVLAKKPFSRKVNTGLLIYCIIMCIYLIIFFILNPSLLIP